MDLADTMVTDDIGRCFCKHNLDMCNICCQDFRYPNRLAEIDCGMRKPPSEIEELAKVRRPTGVSSPDPPSPSAVT